MLCTAFCNTGASSNLESWLFITSCRDEGAPDIYNSLNAFLNSANFHSFRNPSVPILKLNIGGTEGEIAKSEEARRMVPSPPKVVIRSTLSVNAEEVDGGCGAVGAGLDDGNA